MGRAASFHRGASVHRGASFHRGDSFHRGASSSPRSQLSPRNQSSPMNPIQQPKSSEAIEPGSEARRSTNKAALSLERKQQKMERSHARRNIASSPTNPINIDFDTQALSKGTKKAGSVVETDPQPTVVAGRGRAGDGAELERRRQGHNPKSLAVSCDFQRF